MDVQRIEPALELSQLMIEIDYDKDDPAFQAWAANWRPYEELASLPDNEAKIALTESGLSHGRKQDIAFVRSVMESVEFAKGINLRKRGLPISPQRKAELGLRANAIVSENYLSILTEKGIANPIESAQLIASAYSNRLASLNKIGRMRHAGIKSVRVIPNNMAAGPCESCLTAAANELPIDDAPAGSLSGCPHPSQCAILLRAVSALDEFKTSEQEPKESGLIAKIRRWLAI